MTERHGEGMLSGSKRHSIQTVEQSQRPQTAVQIVVNLPAMGARFTVFLGEPAMRTCWMAGLAPHKSG